jgi:hypothetical protein
VSRAVLPLLRLAASQGRAETPKVDECATCFPVIALFHPDKELIGGIVPPDHLLSVHLDVCDGEPKCMRDPPSDRNAKGR